MDLFDPPSSAVMVVGTTAITGGTDTRVLFDDGGKIGESAGLTYTKASGLLAATVLTAGGAIPGTNALAVTGSGAFSGPLAVGIATNKTGDIYVGDNSIASLYMDGSGGTRGAIYLRSSGGTQAARTISPNNSTVGNIEGFSYTPTGGYWPGASMDFVIDGNVTDGQAAPMRIDFFVNANNAATTKAVSFLSDKSVQFLGGIGFSTTNTLDIGTSATVLAPRTIYAGTSFVGPVVSATTRVATPAMGNSAAAGTYLQAQGSVNYFAIDNWVTGGSLTGRATGIYGWMPGADPDATGPDTAISRISASLIGIGNGAQGDFSAALKLASAQLTADRSLILTNQTSSAAAQVGTLTNAPAAGNPGFWLKVSIGGVNYSVPCWAG